MRNSYQLTMAGTQSTRPPHTGFFTLSWFLKSRTVPHSDNHLLHCTYVHYRLPLLATLHSFVAQADGLEARTETLLDYFIVVEKEVTEKQRVSLDRCALSHSYRPAVHRSCLRPTYWWGRMVSAYRSVLGRVDSKYVTFDNMEEHSSNTCW
jgi:hypothetical protein